MRETRGLRVWVHTVRTGVHPPHTHTKSMRKVQSRRSKPRLTFPKLPFPNTRRNSKLSMPNLLEELTPIPFPSLEPSFPCRLSVDLEMSFCKEEEGRNHTVSTRWVWTGMAFLAVCGLSLRQARGETNPGQMFSSFH